MKNRLFIPILAAMAMLGMAGCEKEKTNTDLLTAGPWYVHSITDSLGRVTMHHSQYTPCERDNYFEFDTDGNFYNDSGDSLCSPHQTARSEPYKWRFVDNENRFQIDDMNGIPNTYGLAMLGQDTFKWLFESNKVYIILVHHL